MTTPEQIEALERQMMVAAMAGRDDVLDALIANVTALRLGATR